MPVVVVVRAMPGAARVRTLQVPEGTTVIEAVRRSGVLESGEAELTELDVGIFSRPVPPDRAVREGDRIELYRPLDADPKELRRRRSARSRSGLR